MLNVFYINYDKKNITDLLLKKNRPILMGFIKKNNILFTFFFFYQMIKTERELSIYNNCNYIIVYEIVPNEKSMYDVLHTPQNKVFVHAMQYES